MNDLSGKTILLTRTADGAAPWAAVLESLGARVFNLPCIVCEEIRDPGVRGALRAALSDANWLALTSKRGVEAVCRLHPEPLPDRVRIAAVGKQTAEACATSFGSCDLVSRRGTGQSLAEDLAQAIEMSGRPENTRVVVAAADRAEHYLEKVLEPRRVWVTRISVYRTRPRISDDEPKNIDSLGIDAVFLASPSAAQGFSKLASTGGGARIYTIGPTTTRAARSLGMEVAAQATQPDLEGLIEAIQ